MRLKSPTFVNMISILLLSCVLVLQQLFVSCKQPNILFILADDYGFNDIGYHGSEIKTPNLDLLAGQGVKLENYYVQPICTPTRSQLLSGRYQIHTGLQHDIIWWEQPNALPNDSPILPEKLKESGYSTHMVGKWHVGFYKEEYVPTSRGFDSFYGFYGGGEDYYKHDVHGWFNHTFYGYDMRDGTKVDWSANNTYSTELFARQAIDVVAKHDEDKPLFLYVALQAVHSPMEVPERYKEPYSFIKNNYRRTYAGMVACMDEAVGNITQAFQKSGLWNNTLLIFSTDNGGEVLAGGNNWPLRGWKHSLWEGGMRGVGFVSGPLATRGVTNHGLMHVTDWYPTLVRLAGGNLNGTKPLDGFDQWDAISRGEASPRNEILHNIDVMFPSRGDCLYSDTFNNTIRAAIRVGDWKLITGDPNNGSWVPPPELANSFMPDPSESSSKNLWLFNIAKDPTERNDLSSVYPNIVVQLLDRLLYYNQTAVPPRFPKYDPRSDPSLHGGAWGPWE